MVALKKSDVEGFRRDVLATLPSRDEIAAHHLMDETRLVGGLVERAVYSDEERRRIAEVARRLVTEARASHGKHSGIDAFMREYGLSTEEGVILMCLAEALLRIPDADTADRFISEKIAGGQWEKHRGHSDSSLVNASTWGLMLTGRLVKLKGSRGANPWDALKRLVARSGEPVIRQAVRQAVRVLGDQFVLGRSIEEAIGRARDDQAKGYRFSYDMLGEAARSDKDAVRYFERYMAAIAAVGKAAGPLAGEHSDVLMGRPGLSIKLSALHPRFEAGKEERLAAELAPRLMTLLNAARTYGLPITIDAEEQDRLDVTLDMFGRAFVDPALASWTGLGIAVQAYGKRAIPVLRWLRRLSERTGKRIPVRLVKGAYWDSEIKVAQERGLPGYPVFTRKLNTDVSYLACVRLLLSDPVAFYPQFATHNAHTLAACSVAAGAAQFEFQRLHGMGGALYDQVVGPGSLGRHARIYAPVGSHEDLLGYLVRRLLENGANTSFVNRMADSEAPITQIIADPVAAAERERLEAAQVKQLPLPRDIFWPERKNSGGVALYDATLRAPLVEAMDRAVRETFAAGPIVAGKEITGGAGATLLICPHDNREHIGSVKIAAPMDVDAAVASAAAAHHGWAMRDVASRAKVLDLAADLVERDRARLMALLVREGGKTIGDALSEVRETADFLRYYASEGRRLLSEPKGLRSVTGETNLLTLHGRGPFACIAPWNFPLAIFTGQIAAALVAGNTVLAKPAEETPLVASIMVKLLHEAGTPKDVLHLLTGNATVGMALVKDARVRGVAFTGSNEAAWTIQRLLAERRGEIVPFIAETGGLNAMIADSSALAEQVVRDVVRSAFQSAGQRCSAARLLFIQNEIAPKTLDMLAGAVEALDLGDPFDYATDVGPVINAGAQDVLDAHKMTMQRAGREIIDPLVPNSCRTGSFVTPAVYEIERMNLVEREVFGPILHVVRFERGHLPKVVEAINTAGYGLTLGLHSRIDAVADYVAEHARVGNLYVNRSQVGAVPGVQPFGGEGLSGTGPKAGGPNYLMRFATERVRSTDITATGGNVALLVREMRDEG